MIEIEFDQELEEDLEEISEGLDKPVEDVVERFVRDHVGRYIKPGKRFIGRKATLPDDVEPDYVDHRRRAYKNTEPKSSKSS